MKGYEVGDLVLVTFDSPGKVGIEKGMLQYKDKIFRVSKVRPAPVRATTYSETYELEGVVSRMGVPYTITRDWMQPVMEDGDEGRIDRCRRT